VVSPGQACQAAGAAYATCRPLDVTVLMGGPSAEREVSLLSGRAVADALARAGHAVTGADISPADASALDRRGADVVFIALHGDFGESGAVQALCEERGLRYTGSGPRASALALDKVAAKQVFRGAGLGTPDWVLVEEFGDLAETRAEVERLSLPAVVKPVDSGSSIDVTIARTAARRDEAMEELLDRYGRVLVERFVAGREMTVGVLGEEALPVMEILPAREFYDYAAKYADGSGTRYVFDHRLDEETCRRLRQAGLAAHRSLGCRDLSRVDFILDGEGVPQVLEVNTIPGFTSHSLVPMAAARAGVCFEELVDRLVQMAMDR